MWNPVARTRAHSDSSSRPSVDRSDRACSLLSWIDPRRDRWTDVEKPELRPNDGPASTGEPRRGRSTNRGTARIRLTSVAATTWRSRGRPRSSPTSSERPSRSTRIPTNHHTPMDATKYSNSVTWNDDTTLTTQTRKTAGRARRTSRRSSTIATRAAVSSTRRWPRGRRGPTANPPAAMAAARTTSPMPFWIQAPGFHTFSACTRRHRPTSAAVNQNAGIRM
jgi:hypothetical protein